MARRTEIERLKEENERYKVELQVMRGVANSYKLHYESAKQEVAREIFAEIERLTKNHGINYTQRIIEELKKKYMGDKNE